MHEVERVASRQHDSCIGVASQMKTGDHMLQMLVYLRYVFEVKMNRILAAIALASLIASPAFAETKKKSKSSKQHSSKSASHSGDYKSKSSKGPVVKVGGNMKTIYGYRDQKRNSKYEYNSGTSSYDYKGDLHKSALVNDSKIKINADAKAESFDYGGEVTLNADTSSSLYGNNSPAYSTMMYVQNSRAGRLEAGSYKGAANQMEVSANDIAAGTGGINGDYKDWITETVELNTTAQYGNVEQVYLLTPEMPTYSQLQSRANKVTYFTPKYNGLQAGYSFTPDNDIRGTVSSANNIYKNSGKNFDNIHDLALRYNNKYGEADYTLGAVGQLGKATKNSSGVATRKDLRAWELGAVTKFRGFSLAGSFSDWGNTGTPKAHVPGKKYGASFYTLGAGYQTGSFKGSITHMASRKANVFLKDDQTPYTDSANYDDGYNKHFATSFGADYNVAPGLTPFAEVTLFDSQRSNGKPSNDGTVVLMGSRFDF
jgi:hypothetical protein